MERTSEEQAEYERFKMTERLNRQQRNSINTIDDIPRSQISDSNMTLFNTLLTDSNARAKVLELLMQEGIVNKNKKKLKNKFTPTKKLVQQKFNSPVHKVNKQYNFESPSAQLRKKALKKTESETSDSSESSLSNSFHGKPLPFEEILKGVIAIVDVISGDEDRSEVVKTMMRAMGATILDTFSRKITHVVFKDGSYRTFEKAKLVKAHLVSVLWLEACKRNKFRVPENRYPALDRAAYEYNVSTLCQSMQRDFDKLVQDEKVRRSNIHHSQRNSEFQPKRRTTMFNMNYRPSQQELNLLGNETKSDSSSSINSTRRNSVMTSDAESIHSNVSIGIIPSSQSEQMIFRMQNNVQNHSTIIELTDEESLENHLGQKVKNSFELKQVQKIRSPESLNRNQCIIIPDEPKDDDSSLHLHITTTDESNANSKSRITENSNTKISSSSATSLNFNDLNENLCVKKSKNSRKTIANIEINPKNSIKKYLITNNFNDMPKKINRRKTIANNENQSSKTGKIKETDNKTEEQSENKNTPKPNTKRITRKTIANFEINPNLETPINMTKKTTETDENIETLNDVNSPKTVPKRRRKINANIEISKTDSKAVPRKTRRTLGPCDLNTQNLANENESNILSTDQNILKENTTLNTVKKRRFRKLYNPDESLNEEDFNWDEENKTENTVSSLFSLPIKKKKYRVEIPIGIKTPKNKTLHNIEHANRIPKSNQKQVHDIEENPSEKQKKDNLPTINEENIDKRRESPSENQKKNNLPTVSEEKITHQNIPNQNLLLPDPKSSKPNDRTALKPKTPKKTPEPKNIPKTPAKVLKTPKTPKVATRKSLRIVRKSPKSTEKSPDIFKNKPETSRIAEKQTKTIQKFPKITEKSPKILKNKPETSRITQKQTKTIQKSPKSTEKSPEIIQKEPEAPKTPENNYLSKQILENISERRSTIEFQTKKQKKISPKIKLTQNPTQKLRGITCTRLHRPDVVVFERITNKLGGFKTQDEVSDITTHLVAGQPSRTVNMLRAIARGCWILRQEWLFRSLEAGKWLDEEEFEMTEYSSAVQKCRLERQTFGPFYSMDIFKDCGNIYICRSSTPRASDLEELVTLCSGTIVRNPRQAQIIVGEYLRYENVICVNEKWVLECISNYKKKSFKNYLMKGK